MQIGTRCNWGYYYAKHHGTNSLIDERWRSQSPSRDPLNRTVIFLFLITTTNSSLNVSSVITITRLMVARFCRNKFPSDNSQYPWIVFTQSCSPDGTISTKVNTLNKCLSSFGSFKVFGLFTKYTNSLRLYFACSRVVVSKICGYLCPLALRLE